MRIISLFILILYGNIYAYSQQVYRGTVNDSQTGKGIEDAVVSLLNEQMLIIDFTYTDKKGDFLISSDSVDRKSTRLNSSHSRKSRMPSSA